jgi:putative PIN family toxin of toxin-antitoxin system
VRVTADTNIWISAFIFTGKPRRLIDMASEGKVELAVSDAIIAETSRILKEVLPGRRNGLIQPKPPCATSAVM